MCVALSVHGVDLRRRHNGEISVSEVFFPGFLVNQSELVAVSARCCDRVTQSGYREITGATVAGPDRVFLSVPVSGDDCLDGAVGADP